MNPGFLRGDAPTPLVDDTIGANLERAVEHFDP